ncbi:hypothetical protein Hanom_Chr08g00742961 [Helianthus anomalus]
MIIFTNTYLSSRPGKRVGSGWVGSWVQAGSGQNGSIIKKGCFCSSRNGSGSDQVRVRTGPGQNRSGSERIRVRTDPGQNGFRVGSGFFIFF